MNKKLINLINYYKGWPNSGQYYNKIQEIYNNLHLYLINLPNLGTQYTVIFDIDDTLVFTDPVNLYPNKQFPLNWYPGYMIFPPIDKMVEICKLCYNLGFKVIIITARPYASESSSLKNLELIGVKFHEIYHNHQYPDINFKIDLKKKLTQTNNIILSVGDQWPDIQGLDGCLCIKLPSIPDNIAYFTYDNKNYYII